MLIVIDYSVIDTRLITYQKQQLLFDFITLILILRTKLFGLILKLDSNLMNYQTFRKCDITSDTLSTNVIESRMRICISFFIYGLRLHALVKTILVKTGVGACLYDQEYFTFTKNKVALYILIRNLRRNILCHFLTLTSKVGNIEF